MKVKVKKEFESYIDNLIDCVDVEEDIERIEQWDLIEVEYLFLLHWKRMIWQVQVPWIMSIVNEWEVNENYFPRSVIIWILHIIMASVHKKYWFWKEPIDFKLMEIILLLQIWQLPTVEEMNSIQITNFTIQNKKV